MVIGGNFWMMIDSGLTLSDIAPKTQESVICHCSGTTKAKNNGAYCLG